jgi:hypothetical protein
MNDTNTSLGGWPASKVRTYLNNDIYNALPNELQSVIIDTFVVSGHGTGDSSNFETTDKLYLFGAREIWENCWFETAKNNTRQPDIYLGVTSGNSLKAVKKYNGTNSEWWLRTANSSYNTIFYFVGSGSGAWGTYTIFASFGISPVFRIG